MTLEIAALIVDSVAAVSALFMEGERKRQTKKSNGLAVALQTLDVEAAIGAVGPVALAGSMRGKMTAAMARKVLLDHDVRVQAQELLLATIVDDRDDELELLSGSIASRVVVVLGSKVEASDARFFGEALAHHLREVTQQVVDHMRAVDPSTVLSNQQLVTLKRISAILDRIAAQNDAIKRADDADYRARAKYFLREYRRMCIEAHGFIQPPDFETNQKLPIADLYVVPTNYRHHHRAADQQRTMLEGTSYAEFVSAVDRTVLLGDPGGGKSTLSNYLATDLAGDAAGPVPFHVTLREYAPQADELSILRFIEHNLSPTYQVDAVEGVIEDLLLTGRSVVIFDGLDELIDPTKRRAITHAVEMFGLRYPLTRVLVTSRRVGYDQARLDPNVFQTRHIGEFDDGDVSEYVTKWFASQSAYTPDQAARLSKDFILHSEEVGELRTNPLMLSLMCIIFRGENFIPRNRPAIYEKCANLLFEKWDGHRRIIVPLKARDHVDAAMKYVAYQFLEAGAGESGITETELIEMMTQYLHSRALETLEAARSAAQEFVDFCSGRAWVFSDAGTTGEGEQLFTFTHRTFMEYFAAVHLIRISDTPEALAKRLLPRVAKEEWDVVAQLAVQQAEKSVDRGTERVLEAMLSERKKRSHPNRGRVLRFVASCTKFALISPSLVRRIAAATVDHAVVTTRNGRNRPPVEPFLELLDAVPGQHREAAVDAVRARLLSLANSVDADQRTGAVMIVLVAFVRSFSALMGTRDRRADLPIRSMLIDLVRDQPAPFAETLEHDPASWTFLYFMGAGSEHELRAHLKHTPQFGTRYWGDPIIQRNHATGYSFVRLLGFTGRYSWHFMDEAMQARLAGLSSLFVRDFLDDPSRAWDTTARSRFRGSFSYLNLGKDQASSQDVRDALLIAFLGGQEELVYYHRRRRARSMDFRQERLARAITRSDDAAWEDGLLDRMELSEPVRDFAADWADGKVDIFHSLAAKSVDDRIEIDDLDLEEDAE